MFRALALSPQFGCRENLAPVDRDSKQNQASSTCCIGSIEERTAFPVHNGKPANRVLVARLNRLVEEGSTRELTNENLSD